MFKAQNIDNYDAILKKYQNEIYINPDKVIKICDSILVQKDINVNIKIKTLKLKSDAFSSKRDYQKSLDYMIKANDILPRTEDELLKIIVLTKMGILYHQLKIYDKSVYYLDESEIKCRKYAVKDSVSISLSTNYIVRGFIFKEKLNCDIAISFFDKAIKEIKQSSKYSQNYNKVSIAKYNKGNCYLLMGKLELAKASFLEAEFFAEKQKSSSLKSFALKGLAQVNTLKGDYHSAISQLEKSLKISSLVYDLVLYKEIYKGLSENYLATKNLERHKYYNNSYLNTLELLNNKERLSLNNILDQKDQEIEILLREERKFKSFWHYLLLILIFIVPALFISKIKKIKKENNIVENNIKSFKN
jgi:tetratricopeptide (TPR) repeat protein